MITTIKDNFKRHNSINFINHTDIPFSPIRFFTYSSNLKSEITLTDQQQDGTLTTSVKIYSNFILFIQIKLEEKIKSNNPKDKIIIEEFNIKIMKQTILQQNDIQYKNTIIKFKIPSEKKCISLKQFLSQKYYFYGFKKINPNSSYLFLMLFNQFQIINIYANKDEQLKYKVVYQKKFEKEQSIYLLGEFYDTNSNNYEIFLMVKTKKKQETELIKLTIENEKNIKSENLALDKKNINLFRLNKIIRNFNCKNNFLFIDKTEKFVMLSNIISQEFQLYEVIFDDKNKQKIFSDKINLLALININNNFYLICQLLESYFGIFKIIFDTERKIFKAILNLTFNLGIKSELAVNPITGNKIIFTNKENLIFTKFDENNFKINEIYKIEIDENIKEKNKYISITEDDQSIYYIFKNADNFYMHKFNIYEKNNYKVIEYENENVQSKENQKEKIILNKKDKYENLISQIIDNRIRLHNIKFKKLQNENEKKVELIKKDIQKQNEINKENEEKIELLSIILKKIKYKKEENEKDKIFFHTNNEKPKHLNNFNNFNGSNYMVINNNNLENFALFNMSKLIEDPIEVQMMLAQHKNLKQNMIKIRNNNHLNFNNMIFQQSAK